MYIVVALTVVVGVAMLTSNRGQVDRVSAVSLSLAVFGAALWVLFVQLFQSAASESQANVFLQFFTLVALLMPFGCLSYAASLWGRKSLSVIVILVALLISTTIGCLISSHNGLFYNDIVMLAGNNYVTVVDSPLTLAYFGEFALFFTVSIIIIIAKALKSKNAILRRGLIYLGCGLALSMLFSGTTNVVLPMIGRSDLFWAGPLSVAVTMLFTYFITLRYKLFVNSSRLLQSLTYLVVVAITAIAYTCLFYLVFTLVFRGASPSDEIIIFNFIMIIIVILAIPTINHTIEYVKKVIADNGSQPQEQNEAE
jgi:hypothetical protein